MKDELTIHEKRRFAVSSIFDCGRFEDIKDHLLSQYEVRRQLLFILPAQTNRKRRIEKRRLMKLNPNKVDLESFWNKRLRKMPEPMRAVIY